MKLYLNPGFRFKMSGKKLQCLDSRIVHCQKTDFLFAGYPEALFLLLCFFRQTHKPDILFRKINLLYSLLIQPWVMDILQKYPGCLLPQNSTVSGNFDHTIILIDIDPGFFGTADQNNILRGSQSAVFHGSLNSICDLTTC